MPLTEEVRKISRTLKLCYYISRLIRSIKWGNPVKLVLINFMLQPEYLKVGRKWIDCYYIKDVCWFMQNEPKRPAILLKFLTSHQP